MFNNSKVLLEITNLQKNFGGLSAIDGLDMHVYEGEILGVIGPNGAGKTTLYNVISGFYGATKGKIIFRGDDITSTSGMNRMCKKGLLRTFQANSLFRDETVRDNIIFGFHLTRTAGSFQWFFNTGKVREQEQHIREKTDEILEYMGLSDLSDDLAKNLPHGQQRALGVAIALAADPKLLLLDEPLTGMNPTEKTEMVKLISNLNKKGITICIIEHDVASVVSLCHRIVVLNYGRKIAEGLPSEIVNNKDVITAYLGMDTIL
jgi:branched-chain amino acid transport system ATP-binding protein